MMAPHCCKEILKTENNWEKMAEKSDVPMEAATNGGGIGNVGINGWNHHPCK